MKNNEHQVIHVDFKAKKKIDTEKYIQYNWVDGFSKTSVNPRPLERGYKREIKMPEHFDFNIGFTRTSM